MARFDEITPDTAFSRPYAADERVTIFLRSVYGWMAAGLAITAVVAYFVAANPALVLTIARNRALFWGLVIAQLGMVVWLSARVQSMAPGDGITAVHGLLRVDRPDDGVRAAGVHRRVGGDDVLGHGRDVRCDGALRHASPSAVWPGWGQFLFMGLIGVVHRVVRRHVLAQRRPAVRALVHRRDRVHRTDGVRCAAAEGDGAVDAGRPDRRRTRSSARSRSTWTSSTCS